MSYCFSLQVGAIHFANTEAFRHVLDTHLYPQTDVTPTGIVKSVTTGKHVLNAEESRIKSNASDPLSSMPLTSDTTASVPITKYLIIDCSALSYVDLSGTKELISLHKDLVKKGITLMLANCYEPLMKQLDRCKLFQTFPKSQIYPSITDAVLTLESPDNPDSVDPTSILQVS